MKQTVQHVVAKKNLFLAYSQTTFWQNNPKDSFTFRMCLLRCVDQHGYAPSESAVNDKDVYKRQGLSSTKI